MATKKRSKKKRSSKKIKDSRVKWFQWGAGILITGLTLFILFLVSIWIGLFGQIPDREALQTIENNSATEVFSADGKLMGRYFIENRLTINNKDISSHVLNALIATEDRRYFEHEGVDYRSLGRVVLKSIMLGKRSQGGGSTISQQLARNLFPREGRGWHRIVINKTKEAFIALRLEQIYSKEQILNLYLNTVPFGENLYGIETASQRFFNKRSANLDPQEAATLVGMLAANTAYNPRLHPEISKQRRNIVLRRMQEEGYLEEVEAQKHIDSPLGLNYKRIDQNTGIAPYFRDRIELQAREILKNQYGDSINLYTDGLKIYTTIDSRLQDYAERSGSAHMTRLQNEFDTHWEGKEPWANDPDFFDRILKQSKAYQALRSKGLSDDEIRVEMKKTSKIALPGASEPVLISPMDSIRHSLLRLHLGFIAIEPQTGKILSWIGGINHEYFQFDHVMSKRQVGSTFKPFVYAAALQNGMKPCEFISNEQRIYEAYDGWSPSNSDGNHQGFYSIKGGLTHSVNTISAELIMRIGPSTVTDLVQTMGIKQVIPPLPSIALGTAELSLLGMVTAYTVFPQKGSLIEPWGLDRIEDGYGQVLFQREPKEPNMTGLNQETSLIMVELLKNVVDSGTAKSLRSVYNIQSEVAGKTGTTQDNGDGWFIGFTPEIVAGVWVGAEYPGIHFRTTDLGQGAYTALPVFGRFIRQVEQDPFRNKYTSGSFDLLPSYLIKELDCLDYSLDDPEATFFNRLFGLDRERDSLRIQKRTERQARRDSLKLEMEQEGVTGIKRTFRLLFGNKKKVHPADTTKK